MVMLSCRKGSGHWEKATCTAQTCLSLDAGVCLEALQGFTAPMHVKADGTLDQVGKLCLYVLECFCPVFYNTMYITIPLPETIFSSFFCQILSCLFEWETPDMQSWLTGRSMSLQDAVKSTNSQLIAFHRLQGRQSRRCGKGWGGGGVHSNSWCKFDHLVGQEPSSKNRLEYIQRHRMESSPQTGGAGHTSWKVKTLERSWGWITLGRWLRRSSKSDSTAEWEKWGTENGQSGLLIEKHLTVTSCYCVVIHHQSGDVRKPRGGLGMTLPACPVSESTQSCKTFVGCKPPD